MNLVFLSAFVGAIFYDSPQQSTFMPEAYRDNVQAEQLRDKRTISLSIDSTIEFAIKEIARQSGYKMSYAASPVFSKSVKVSVKAVTVDVALKKVLEGTGLIARFQADGSTVVIGFANSNSRDTTSGLRVAEAGGIITGVVRDSGDKSTTAGLPGASVTISTLGVSAVTGKNGQYSLKNIPPGEYRVNIKLLGYSTQSHSVSIGDNARVTLNITLKPSASVLSEVVTTATGQQKKLEVGNSITSLNVDSIMQVAPISSVTDLLEGRVPGMTVQRTSGSPGDPARIRIRGTNSIYANNDPIVVVDGMRIYSQQSDERNINSGNSVGGGVSTRYATQSPIDQIDPNSIAKIEVLKGPSASALYGSDAANGVIIITTKSGKNGPPSWSVRGEQGFTYMPGKWPQSMYKFVTPLYGGPPTFCVGFCGDATVDSVIMFQALNDPELTALGRGLKSGISSTVSGGVQVINYSFTLSGGYETGVLKLPEIEEKRYEKYQDAQVPGWMRRPDRLDRKGLQSRIQVQFSENTNVALVTMLSQNIQRRTSMSSSLNSAIGSLEATYVDKSQLSKIPILGNPYERVVSDALNLTTGVSGSFRPVMWLPLTTSLGFNSGTRNDEMSIARGLTIFSRSGQDSAASNGSWKGSSKANTEITANMSTVIPLRNLLSLAMGSNFTQGTTNDQSGSFSGIGIGITDPSTGEDSMTNRFSRSTSQRNSFGWFMEPKLNFHSRFFVIPGFRLDNNGLAGRNAGLNRLPKINLSYILSDESFFPYKSLVNMLRLRMAYGVAGVQPNAQDVYRLYERKSANSFGDLEELYGSILSLKYLGNSKLKPERGTEIEGGFDLELLNNRVSIDLTYYRKRRIDAIVNNNYASSVNGGGQIRMNVGDIDNTGTEIGVNAQLFESRGFGVNLNGSFARMKSKVVRLNNQSDMIYIGTGASRTIYAVGYPVEGRWTKPILGYKDLDEDGWLTYPEVVLGPNDVYVGSTEPKYQINMNPTVSMFSGMLNVNAAFSYTSGQMQTRDIYVGTVGRYSSTWGLSPDVSVVVQGHDGFDRQLAWVHSFQAGSDQFSGFMQVVNILRLQSSSLSLNLTKGVLKKVAAKRGSVSVQGSNLGLWTNYIGVDPNVNSSMGGSGLADGGQLPQPRAWQIVLNLTY